MPEISKKEKQLEWTCRVLMTADLFVIVSGYLSWFQTKRQLVSPLIPQSTVFSIFSDGGDLYFKYSLLAALIFLAGLWFYSFQKKMPAIILFLAVIVLFFMKDLFISMQVLPTQTSTH